MSRRPERIPHNEAKVEVDILGRMAESYNEMAIGVLKELIPTPIAASEFTSYIKDKSRKAKFFSGITNICLSIELHLKAISLASKGSAPFTHELDKLWNKIDDEIKESIEYWYLEFLESDNPLSRYEITFVFPGSVRKSTKPVKKKKSDRKPSTADVKKVHSVLRFERDSYEIWRYPHDALEFGKNIEMKVYLGSLYCISESLRKHVVKENADNPTSRWW